MDDLKQGDLFCLNDRGDGHEKMQHIYRCMKNPVVCVEVEFFNYA